MQESTTAADEIRSLRVEGLLPMMDAVYLFNCFYESANVLAATVLHRCKIEYKTVACEICGFVEFASHKNAKFVLESYNGMLMPNYNSPRFSLSWDTDGYGTKWRSDYAYERCSFFGYDWVGEKLLDAKKVIELYKNRLPPVVSKKRVAGDSELEAAYPNTGVKSTDTPLTQCRDMYRGGYGGYQNYQHAGPSLTIQQTQWYDGCGAGSTFIPNNMMLPQAGYAGYVNYKQHGFYPQAGYVNYQQHGFYHQADHVNYQQHGFYQPQRCAYMPPCQLLQTQWTDSSDVKEKELYLCFSENGMRSAYVIRTIKLSELTACSCDFDTGKIIKCECCSSKDKPESQLRQRAWLCIGENVPTSCGGEAERIPQLMGCCATGSQIIFAGGVVVPPELKDLTFVPSGDVYSFATESCSWQSMI